jgi:hypothetical protein
MPRRWLSDMESMNLGIVPASNTAVMDDACHAVLHSAAQKTGTVIEDEVIFT